MDADTVRATAERYFSALRAFDLDAVVDCFTEDAFYSHPPYDPSADRRAEATGRPAIATMLRDERGDRPIVQEVRHCVVDGDIAYIEGTARVDSGDAFQWVSSVRVAPDGRFRRYVSFASYLPVGTDC